ncbi:hypothetical protein KQH61_03930 [bacterium]|nr:hypothetical protein [bacterium]MCB2179052.1 hypothetical protein [bacterium]
MSYMLWQLIRDVYQQLGRAEVDTATGGTDVTLIDSKLAGQALDDEFNAGTIMILAADGEAPEGEFQRVADYEGSSGTFTFESALTAAPASGDLYLRVDSFFPHRSIIEQVNLALAKLGEITLVDTSLETASGQTEYPAAAAWKRRPPIQVEIQTHTGDPNNHGWQNIPWWEYVPAAAGAEGLLIFDQALPAGRNLRVWYSASHPQVSLYNDVINELIHPAVAAAAVLVEALTWQAARLSGKDGALQKQLETAQADLARIKEHYPIWKPNRRSRMRLAGR